MTLTRCDICQEWLYFNTLTGTAVACQECARHPTPPLRWYHRWWRRLTRLTR